MPKEDEIKWLEWRLIDQEDPDSYQKDVVPEAEDIKVWLARERDKLSWSKIIKEIYKATAYNQEAAKSKARRAYARVERYLKKGKGHLTGGELQTKKMFAEFKDQFVPGYWE